MLRTGSGQLGWQEHLDLLDLWLDEFVKKKTGQSDNLLAKKVDYASFILGFSANRRTCRREHSKASSSRWPRCSNRSPMIWRRSLK